MTNQPIYALVTRDNNELVYIDCGQYINMSTGATAGPVSAIILHAINATMWQQLFMMAAGVDAETAANCFAQMEEQAENILYN